MYKMKTLQLFLRLFCLIFSLIIIISLSSTHFSERSIPWYVYFDASRIDNNSISFSPSKILVKDMKVNNSFQRENECVTNLSSYGGIYQRTDQDDQSKRIALVKKICEKEKVFYGNINKRHFLLDHKYGILYCWIHKVASTSWVAFMARLKGINVPPGKVYRRIGYLAAKSIEEAMSAANDYPFRLIVVRHPFHRLISAYRDRIWAATKKYSVQAWAHVPRILRLNRISLSHSSAVSFLSYENRTLMTVPTFAEFVEYLIVVAGLHQLKGKNFSKEINKLNISAFDAHWVPYHHHCSICNISYNEIIKLETIKEDVAHFIKKLNYASKNEIFRRLPKEGSVKASVSIRKDVGNKVNPVNSIQNEFEEKISGNLEKNDNKEYQDLESKEEISDLFLHHLQQSDIGPSCLCFYFSQLSKAQFENLKKIYHLDLKMFNYDTNDYETCLTSDK